MRLTTNEKVSIAVGAVAVSVSGIIFGVYKYKMSDGANPVLKEIDNSISFGIGKYNEEYPDWRKATKADWTNPAFQAALVQAHREGGGWALLEEPLECNGPLCVAEGYVQIDEENVIEVGYYSRPNVAQQLRGVYPAMNYNTKVAWTTTTPALGNNWSVRLFRVFDADYNPPCLFVRDPVSSAGKKTRRHKKSKTKKYGKC